MISSDLRQKIFEQLYLETRVKDWKITGSAIQARTCIVYKASSAQHSQDIAIKIYREDHKTNFIAQHDVLKPFAQSLNLQKNEYFVPKVYGSFPENNTFLMEWVHSPALEWRLWRYCYSKEKVQSDIRRSFKWLKAFHQHANPEIKTVNIDYYKKSLNKTLLFHEGNNLISKNEVFQSGKQCFDQFVDDFAENFKQFQTTHANLHGDFTPSNILVDDQKVTGIDISADQHLAIENDIALQFSYIAIDYLNMLTRSDFKLLPEDWPLLKIIVDAYDYPNDSQQLKFFLFVFLYQLLRRWAIINDRNKNRRTPLLDLWRLRNSEMIVKNVCLALSS